MFRQELPDDYGEHKQAKASHGRARGIHARGLPSPDRSAHTMFFFLLLFVLFNKRRTRGENCGEREQKPRNNGSVVLRHETGNSRNDAAEEKTQRVLAPLRVPKRRTIHSYRHSHFRATLQRPKATTNHTGMAPSVTQSALNGYRIRIQLTSEAKMKNAIAPAIIERASTAA